MPPSYHATYSTTWRRYAYFLPPSAEQTREALAEEAERLHQFLQPLAGVAREYSALGRSLPPGKNTTMLLRLASARLVECCRPSASSARQRATGGAADEEPFVAIRIDLVGDRFLRQQVRCLVSTAVAAANGAIPTPPADSVSAPAAPVGRDDEQLLLRLCTSADPDLTAHPAPAEGLVFAAAGDADELDPSWLGAALALLEQQAASGAALDLLLSRHVRANGVSQAARARIAAHLEAVVRHYGRLEWRLAMAAVESSPRSRLLASLKLCRGGERAAAALQEAAAPTAAETAWLRALQAPLEDAAMEPSARLECPEWAWPSLVASFGEAAVEAEMRALQRPAPLDLRVNTLRTSRTAALAALHSAGFDAQPTRYSPVGIRLSTRGGVPLGTLPGLLEGKVEPQDEGSQLVALLLGAQPGELVVDYCAGSGGKTLTLAAQMGNKGRLLAMDIDEGRLGRSAKRLVKAGVDNVERHVIETGADKWLKRRKRSFDRVLVDAPCSGVGAWRRNPDARWVRKTRPLHELLPIQADVLQRAARLVRPGGVLVYATCSVLREENEAQVERFLASEDGADFGLAPPDDFHAPLDEPGYLRLTPARHECDGFFGAVLKRNEGGWSRPRSRRPRRRGGGD